MTYEDNAPGWDAIDDALLKLYGEQEPKHYGALIPYALGGPDPLNGISAYVSNTPMPHWHMVTYGLASCMIKNRIIWRRAVTASN